MARSSEIANQMAAPNQPGPVKVVMGAWFEIEPQRAPGPTWLLESADRSRVRVVVASKTLRNARLRSADHVLLGTNGNDQGRQLGSIAKGVPIQVIDTKKAGRSGEALSGLVGEVLRGGG
jgi:hypothetical protein